MFICDLDKNVKGRIVSAVIMRCLRLKQSKSTDSTVNRQWSDDGKIRHQTNQGLKDSN